MKNRLLLPLQLRLFVSACLFLWTFSLAAQCDCFTVNSSTCEDVPNQWSLTYEGDGRVYVGNACTAVLETGAGTQAGNISINAPSGSNPDFIIMGGHSIGDMVPAGDTVIFKYYLDGVATTDTFCFSLVFLDTIPPTINWTTQADDFDCGIADFTKWQEDNIDSLIANSTDNCGIDTVYHFLPDTLVDNCGTFLDTFFVKDNFGNNSILLDTFNIMDDEAPVFTSFPTDLSLQCSDAIPPVASVTATDNCAASITPIFIGADTIDFGTGACADHRFKIRRNWRVTDGCGNITDSTQVISVDDTMLPDFDVPADTVIACGTPTDVSATGDISNITDNCSATFTTSMSEVTVGGSCPQEMTITRTWQVADECGNSLSKSQVISVVDTVAPTAIFPPDITVDCFDDTDDSATGTPTMVNDNCQPNPTTSRVDVILAGSCDHTFMVQRTWKVADACNNATLSVQMITVQDTISPVVINEATDRTITCDVDIATAFSNWIDQHGAATASDNCTVPATELIWTAYVAGTNDPAALPMPNCSSPETGIFQKVNVDFVVSDKCGNRDTTTALFTVADNDPPVIINCPADMTVDTDAGQCESVQTLLLPVVMENCGNTTQAINLSLSQTPGVPAGSDLVETPIDDLVFDFNVNGPPYSALGSATLTIRLDQMDAEAPTEFLNVYGEDGSLLGTVANTPVQCGDTVSSFTIAPNLIDAWAFDGILTISVKPNIPASLPGRFSVNPICPNNLVTASLAYDANFPAGLGFEYSINSGARNAVLPLAPFDETFAQGTNTVNYFFSDCAGNEASCSFEITVEDNEAPVITCPPDEVIDLDAGECDKEVIVPLFTDLTDNCGVTTPSTATEPGDSLSSLITFSFNPNLGDFVANDKTFTFSGLQGDATPGGVKLIIEIQGDVDSSGAYFEISANGMALGTTARGQAHVTAGDCSTPSRAVFTIPAATFNDWTSAGDITVNAVSFMSYPIPPAGPGWGINPCDTSQVHNDGDTDGSFIKATFSYESVAPTFSASGATTIDLETLTPPLEADTILLAQGTTTFTYGVTDLAGNNGDCSFEINLRDVEPPLALCGPAFVDINPSGFDVDTVFAAEIDLGSTDNCTIDTMFVTPSIFSCENQGTENIVLTVTDLSGNVSTCSTFVNVTTQAPAPTAASDCGSTDLQLFANPPPSAAGNNAIYNYTWFNPAGVMFSTLQNPIIQDADEDNLGFYTVQIEGVTFCTSLASVQVTCDLLPLQKPLLQVADNNICASENIELGTAAVCGTSVNYKWFTGPFPGVLMATTQQPAYTMTPPSSGAFSFYVVVERNGCDSERSEEVPVTVNAAPVATAGQASILICEGEQFSLTAINVPQGASCHWTGACGYESFICNPAPITDVEMCNSGDYQLVVTNNGCPSVPDTVFVNVVALPTTPSVSNTTSPNNPACDGESVILTATPVTGAVSYEWTTPVFTTITTSDNVLFLGASDIAKDAGLWTVKVIGNPCESLVSAATTVYIEPLPEAVSSAVTPTSACEGQDVQLTASSASQNVNFEWTYPSGQTIALPNPVLENVGNSDNGEYTLTVTTQFGCSVEASVELEILDRVDITGISSDAPDCVSGPINVDMVATLFPIDDGNYTYLWTGPNGYSSTNQTATISSGSADDSGPYTLVVTNADGCSSLPSTVDVEIPEILPTPILNGVDAACEGDQVTLNATPFSNANAIYVWTTPTGTETTGIPSLTLENLTANEAGTYHVNYLVGNCPSALSGAVEVEVNPIPSIQPSGNSPVCEGDVLELNVNCSAGALYEWNGPGAFGAGVCNPIITNADPDLHSGTYTVRKQVDGCWSEVASLNVEVKPKPEVPTAINAGPYCADTEAVVLSVTNNSATPGSEYVWYDENGQQLGGASPSLNFVVPNAVGLGDGNFEFYVEAVLDGCPSTASVPTIVEVNTVPSNLAEAGPAIDACEGDILTLQATPPTVGTGEWTMFAGNPAGVSIANPDEATTTLSGLTPGVNYIFEWTLTNGACVDYSSDQTDVFLNMIEEADAGDEITVCHTSLATLSANTPISNVGQWSQPSVQEMLGVSIVDPNDPNTDVVGLVPGNSYIFTWSIDGGCGSSSDAILVTVTNENAFAGADHEDCGDGTTELDAIAPLSENGMWTSPDPDIIFATPTDPFTTAENLKAGENILVWTIDNGECGQFSVDSVIIDYQFAPVGANDEVDVKFAGLANLDVTNNDDIPGFFTVNIVQEPLHGKAELTIDGELSYLADVNFIGLDSLQYEICSDGCECARATVRFNVGADAECFAPSIITPNGDGMNDAFVIPCLANADNAFPSVVSIFNQWGDEVFHAEPYQNDWQGTFDGEQLPAGTYFYIVDLGTGDAPLSGYLILQR